eukprot:COSAG02_NODE_7137_length_3161_cov_2.230568_2_plen_169_part_00
MAAPPNVHESRVRPRACGGSATRGCLQFAQSWRRSCCICTYLVALFCTEYTPRHTRISWSEVPIRSPRFVILLLLLFLPMTLSPWCTSRNPSRVRKVQGRARTALLLVPYSYRLKPKAPMTEGGTQQVSADRSVSLRDRSVTHGNRRLVLGTVDSVIRDLYQLSSGVY